MQTMLVNVWAKENGSAIKIMLKRDKNMNTMFDHDRDFFLNRYKDIVRVGNEYCLQKTYEEDENGNIKKTPEHKANLNQNELTKSCANCIHFIYFGSTSNCTIRASLEKNIPKNAIMPSYWVANCDAYSPVFPLNIIKSEKEMVDFIERVQNFFSCQEDYEAYFGFERKWDEETGDILETVQEYYARGGKFKDIPDKYPCVIYFGVADFDGMRGRDEKMDWIYIGESNDETKMS